MKHDDLIAYNRRWVETHQHNPYQREAAKRITVLCNALERPTITDEAVERAADVLEQTDGMDLIDQARDVLTAALGGDDE